MRNYYARLVGEAHVHGIVRRFQGKAQYVEPTYHISNRSRRVQRQKIRNRHKKRGEMRIRISIVAKVGE